MATVRRQTGALPEDYKDFHVCRQHIWAWLNFLRLYHTSYRDIHIDEQALQALPTDGNVYETLPVVNPNTIPPNTVPGEVHVDNYVDIEVDQNGGIERGPGQLDDIHDDEEFGIVDSMVINPIQEDRTETENVDAVIAWPAQGEQAANEYDTLNLLADAWPHLFPFGIGDYSNHGRRSTVSLHDSIEHYIKYAYQRRDSKWCYPFMEDKRFIMYVQNVYERHRIISQANAYITNNIGDANYTIADLQNHEAVETIRGRMHKYGANVLGSPAHLYRERKKLEELNKQLGTATIWMTLSFADQHWEDLYRLFGDPPYNLDADGIRQWKRDCVINNAHLLDSFFVKRVESFVKHFFSEDGLDAFWIWYRYEWQSRGAIHAHLLAKLKSDPGIATMSIEVFQGRKFLRELRAYEDTHPPNIIFDVNSIPSIPDSHSTEFPDDEYQLNWKDLLLESYKREDFIPDKIIEYRRVIARGEKCEKIIVTYRDYILSSINPNTTLPLDASSDTRLPKEIFPDPHSATQCHICTDQLNYKVNYDNYPKLAHQCYRHRCTLDYCMRKGKCRFRFPQKLRLVSTMFFKEFQSKISARFAPATNDRWINSHSPPATAAWGGMVDLQIIIDKESLIHYVAKYGTKVEVSSKGHMTIMQNVVRLGRENESSTKTMLRSAFIKTLGGRDKCKQEATHLAMSSSIVVCSHKFVDIRLNGMTRHVEIDHNGEQDQAVTSYNILDAYALRLTRENWIESVCTDEIYDTLGTMTLQTFASKYHIFVKGNNRNKIGYHSGHDNRIVVFSPTYSSHTTSCNFHLYCYYWLMKYHPWQDFPESLYNSAIRGSFNTDILLEDKRNDIIAMYTRLRAQYSNDIITPEIDNIRNNPNVDYPDDLDFRYYQDNNTLDRDEENDEDDIGIEYNEHFRTNNNDDDNNNVQWNVDHDWQITSHAYTENSFDNVRVDQVWESISNTEANMPSRRVVQVTMLNEQQLESHDIIVNMVLSPINAMYNRCAMLLGGAGSGKSYTLDAIVHTLQQQHNMKCHVAAPTGKAACNVNGHTIFSAEGLKVPVLKGSQTYKPLTGLTLKQYQERLQEWHCIIIDEFTMLSQTVLSHLDKRLRESRPQYKDLPFAGLAVIIIGDPAQLPPVQGSSLWSRGIHLNKPDNMHGYGLYQLFSKVLMLQSIQRVEDGQQDFVMFLKRLRDGMNTKEDWNWIQSNCSAVNKTPLELDEFNSIDTLAIFNTNAEIDTYNMGKLNALHQPITKVSAVHTGSNAVNGNTSDTKQLECNLYLSINSKILLLHNISTRYKLVNGSTGTIMDFIYNEGNNPPQLPTYIVIDFPSYNGPNFFDDDLDKKTWVIMKPVLAEWIPNHKYTTSNNICTRKQYPIRLAWAWTPWKAQGSTFTNKFTLHLGMTEKDHGCSYVAFSRATNIKNILLPQGISLERLTVKIQSLKKNTARIEEEKRLLILHEETISNFRAI